MPWAQAAPVVVAASILSWYDYYMDKFAGLFQKDPTIDNHLGGYRSEDGRVIVIRQGPARWTVQTEDRVSDEMSFSDARWTAIDWLWERDHPRQRQSCC